MTYKSDTSVIGYTIELDDYLKLRNLADQLHGGTDRERDRGHVLWYILSKVEQNPVYDLAKDTWERTSW